MRPGDEPCRACLGGAIPCKGGGNRLCWRRNKESAYIAIILDTYGGARTVVGTKDSLRANTRQGELRYIVPNLIVHEPIAWNDIPIVVERARLELLKWLDRRPNLTEVQYECVEMWKLHSTAQPKGSRNLEHIAYT